MCVCFNFCYFFICREGDSYSYSFNTQALSAHLVTMAGKKTAPFYNMQLIKYEVTPRLKNHRPPVHERNHSLCKQTYIFVFTDLCVAYLAPTYSHTTHTYSVCTHCGDLL